MKKVINDIYAKKDLEKNLPIFADYMSGLYYSFSHVCLSLNYFTFYQAIKKEFMRNKYRKIVGSINRVISHGILSKENLDDNINAIEEVRGRITSLMKVLTSYTDIFERYEYIINRIEYKFREEDIKESYSDEDFTKKLMRYIVEDDDSVVINSKISEVIAELPVRMTKDKFFERLNEGINIYRDSDKKSLEDFLYMVRSSAMLELPKEEDDIFEDLNIIHNDLLEADFDNISHEECILLRDKIKYAAVYIEEVVTFYMHMQHVANNIYAILLLSHYVDGNGAEYELCQTIISDIHKNFLTRDVDENAIEEYLVSLEGRQESISEECMASEHVLDNIRTQLWELVDTEKLKKQYDVLDKSRMLLSESLFVEFNGNNIDDLKMDSEYFEKRKRDFLEEVEGFFKSHSRIVNRAVMSVIISSLPVFFNNISELQDYIYNSLDSCRQKPEKLACIEILESIIENKY